MTRVHLTLLLPAIVCCFAGGGHAAAPTVESMFPAGAQRGTRVTVTFGGKLEGPAPQVWASTADLVFTPTSTPGVFAVKVSPGAPTGPHLVRLYNADGASAPRVFIVGEHPETIESEPNDSVPQAATTRPTTLPAAINATLEKPGDTDCYALRLEAGQTVVAGVQGRRLGSPIDPMLHLYDGQGHQLAFSHDGLGLDPLLVHRATQAGLYIVRVSAFAQPPAADVKLAGSKSCVYRLSLTTGPYVRFSGPMGIQRGHRRPIELVGWNLKQSTIEADMANVPATQPTLPLNVPSNLPLHLDITDHPQLRESEAKHPATRPAPFSVTGRISAAGEADAYPFTARKGDKLSFTVRAVSFHSPLDATLRIEDDKANQLAANDDVGAHLDPRLDWSCPADGTYRAVISDRYGQGGEDYLYHLTLEPTLPTVSATVSTHEYRVTPGSSTAIKLQLIRQNNHTTPLLAVATHLPAGVASTAAPLPDKSGEATLTLTATSEVKPASLPIRILLLSTDPSQPFIRAATFDLAREDEKTLAQQLIPATDSVWLTVLPPAAATRPADSRPASSP